MSVEPRDTPQGKVGLAFARALVAGEYSVAHTMLSASLQATLSVADLKEKFESMVEYGRLPPDFVDVFVAEDSSSEEASDLGWAYVAIDGDGFCEAVTVTVIEEQMRQVIREIEWGRP